MVKYNTEMSFADNMDALFAELEEQRNDHLGVNELDQADKWVVEVITHVQNGIDRAKELYRANPVEAVCEVANAIAISLCDELNLGGLLKVVRTDIFGHDDDGDAFRNVAEYTNCMLDSVGKDNVLRIERRCTRCHQQYGFYIPAIWNDGRDEKVIRQDTRRTNTNSSYEFMCLSGMCDACWQVCFNKEERED